MTEVARFESVATNDDPNLRFYQSRGTTTGATSTTADLPTASNTAYSIEVVVTARCTAETSSACGGVGRSASWVQRYYAHNIGGTVTVGAVQDTSATHTFGGNITSAVTGDCAVAASGTNIRLTCTGRANQTLLWHASWQVSSASS